MWVMMKFYCTFSLVQKMAPISTKFYLLYWFDMMSIESMLIDDALDFQVYLHPCRTSSCDRQTQHLSPPYGLTPMATLTMIDIISTYVGILSHFCYHEKTYQIHILPSRHLLVRIYYAQIERTSLENINLDTFYLKIFCSQPPLFLLQCWHVWLQNNFSSKST